MRSTGLLKDSVLVVSVIFILALLTTMCGRSESDPEDRTSQEEPGTHDVSDDDSGGTPEDDGMSSPQGESPLSSPAKRSGDVVAVFTLPDGTQSEISKSRFEEATRFLRLLKRDEFSVDEVFSHIVLYEEALQAKMAVTDEDFRNAIKDWMGTDITHEQTEKIWRVLGFRDMAEFEDAYKELLLVQAMKNVQTSVDDDDLTEDIFEEFRVENQQIKLEYAVFKADIQEEEAEPVRDIEIARRKADACRQCLLERTMELEDVRTEIDAIRAEAEKEAEEKIAALHGDRIVEDAEKIRSESKNAAGWKVRRLLDRNMGRVFQEACAECSAEVVELDFFSRALSRNVNALKMEKGAARVLIPSPFIARMMKGEVAAPFEDTVNQAVYLVHVVDKRFPSRDEMTREDAERYRIKLMQRRQAERYLESIRDNWFSMEDLMERYKLTLISAPEDGEDPSSPEGSDSEHEG